MQNAAASTTEARSVDDNRASNTNVDPTKPYLGRDRPVYNPLNFVPNVDVVKSQNALNSKLHAVEPLQQNLNLVPLLPGGNFFKPSFSAQSELLVKPKLNSDLQAYAEQMFKESLKTIYNTQKWNNDRKTGLYNRYNITDSDIARLKNELQRLKASLDSRKKKNHDADPSETKVRTTELANRKPDELMAALEQMLKKNPSDSLHNFHGTNKPHRHRRPNEKDNYSLGTTGDLRENKYEFLTPPQLNSHRGKNHFQTVDKPGKKRPGSSRYKSYNHQNHHHSHHHHHQHHHGPRSHPRSNSKAGGIEASGSNIEPVRVDGLSKYGNIHDSRQFRKGSPFDSHLGSTSPFSREKISHFSKTGLKGVEKGKESAYNNPKMHNFYGMLMKNKQLPGGDTPNYFRDKDQLKQFFETEKQRMQQKFYDDALRDYFKKMSDLGYTGISNSRISSPEKRKIIFTVLLISALNSATGVEFFSASFARPRRGIVETSHDDDKPRSIDVEKSSPRSNYKNAKIVKEPPPIGSTDPPMYGDIFKQSSPYIIPPFQTQNVPFLPYSDNLFTISAGYKIGNDDNFGKPVNQAKIYNQNVAAGTKLQIPVYKTNYPAKSSETYAPVFQNKKASVSLVLVQFAEPARFEANGGRQSVQFRGSGDARKGKHRSATGLPFSVAFPSYLSNLQNQLVLKPTVEDNQFNFGEAETPEKVNTVQQLGSHFLSPFLSFQGQVIPISTVANNAPFPRYKGAAIQVYPTVAGFSTTAYQPLQAQQQFQFGHGIVQPVDNSGRPPSPSQEIRSDVEIIDEKKPRPPPRSDDDNGDRADDDDHDYAPPERQYEANSQDDDYEVKSFKAPPAEGDFKPSTSFPFKEYDEKFGRYSNRDKIEGDEKSVSKNRDYSSSGDDDDESSARYRSEDTSSKAFYDRQEEEEGEYDDVDKPRDYERRRTKEEKDSEDEEFDASYKAKLSKQRGRNIYEVEDPSSEGSQRNFRYYKDTGGYSSVPETKVYEGGFGYKIFGRRAVL
ncbi:hypothetical protein APICC_09926 [Apis cerana cerana]|uniref:Uncharacterized protein n=1 Tax=Apis cerana cerana TaxID=94128 RepID=A0A2A3ES51_APICC|nr:hypothetical protein APICC_09926 [Apis cerana cerana]